MSLEDRQFVFSMLAALSTHDTLQSVRNELNMTVFDATVRKRFGFSSVLNENLDVHDAVIIHGFCLLFLLLILWVFRILLSILPLMLYHLLLKRMLKFIL